MKKLFCFIILSAAFPAIGSQAPKPIPEYFGPARSEKRSGPKPIRHSFGGGSEEDEHPLGGYFGPGRKEFDERGKNGGGSSINQASSPDKK